MCYFPNNSKTKFVLNITWDWVGTWSYSRLFDYCPFNAYPKIVSIATQIIHCSAVIVFDMHVVTDTFSFTFRWIPKIIIAPCIKFLNVKSDTLKSKVYCDYGESLKHWKIRNKKLWLPGFGVVFIVGTGLAVVVVGSIVDATSTTRVVYLT